MFKSVFKLDTENRTFLVGLNACETIFRKYNIAMPKEKKVNISRSTGVNRADDRSALLV